MSANSKWPDFRLASTFWGLVGSNSKDGDNNRDPAAIEQSALQHNASEGSDENAGASAMAGADDRAAMMADIDGRPIDGIGDFDGLDRDDERTGAMNTDFGSLEMFDSTTGAPPFATQANTEAYEQNGQAPAALMSTDDPALGHKKKKKRDKAEKKKKKKRKDGAAAEPHEEGHHKRSKRQSTVDTNDVPLSTEEVGERAGSQELGEDAAAQATQSKRKRKSSDGQGEKRRKKRKSHEHAPEDADDQAAEDAAKTFLHRDANSGAAPVAAMEGGDTAESDPQGSPTVAHVRRRSQSREARSREPSASRDAGQDGAEENEDERRKRHHDAISNLDVENLAREAWNEHINGQAGQVLDAAEPENPEPADVEMGDAADVENEHSTTSTPRPKRTSTRKKSKPTFFDQPPELPDLPSPSAMTPKPRRRAKTATKKAPKPRAPRVTQTVDDLDGGAEYDVDDIDAPKGRRNRMAGYTKGRFTDDELDRITKQVKAFAEEHELDQVQVNEMIQASGGTSAGEAHAQLWARLFAECPDRHRQKVINIARKKFHNFVARGTWTPEQDAELRQFIDIHGTQWSKIAALINRHPEDLRDRYRNYIICGDSQRRDAWTEEEESRLAQYVIEAMASIDELRRMQPARKLLQSSYEELIDWQNVSERMDRTRSRLQCITKWKSMNLKTHGNDQLSSLQPDSKISFYLDKARRQISDMPAAERYRLLIAVRDSGASSDGSIPWMRLLDKEYRSKWHRSTQGLLWHRLKKTVPGYQTKSIRDCAQQLMTEYDQKDELPDVDGDDYNDIEEMQVVQITAAPVAASKKGGNQGKRKQPELSQDYVAESADEVEEQEDTQDGGLQIDPALMGETPAEEEPEAELGATPKSSKKSTSGKKTPAKKGTSARKKGSSKNGMLSQDPIEDTEPSQEQPEGGETEDVVPEASQDLDFAERPRKKKGSGKMKTYGGRSKKRQPSPLPQPATSSDMEDMEDLPARVPS